MKPSLRFPEFKNEWQEKRLGDVFYFKKTNSLSRADFTEKGSISNIHYGDIHTKLPAYLDTRSYQLPKITSIGKSIGEFVEVGDLSMADASENYTDIGKSVEIVNICDKEKVVSGLHTLLLSPKEKHAIGFLGQYFQNGTIREKIRKIANGISVLGISKNDLSKLTLLTPCIKEQEKIADFLRGGDERMTSLEKKVDAMREYKKGVMSAIFSGKLRFKDENGNPYPDWEERRLEDISRNIPSNITANNIGSMYSGRYIVYGASGEVGKVDNYQHTEAFTAIVKDGAGIGRIIWCEEKNSILGTLTAIYPKNTINAKFLYYMLHQIKFEKYATGSTIPHIYYKDFSRERFLIPIEEEQRKIADFLSAIDHKIELEQTRLDRTKDFKKGLLQRMFV